MNADFHFYGTGTAAYLAMDPQRKMDPRAIDKAKIIANAAEFVDYFVGDYYWSYWQIVNDESKTPKKLFLIENPQLSAQFLFGSVFNYYEDYWLAFHFPPGNKTPEPKYSGEFGILEKKYISKFKLRKVNDKVHNGYQLCRPYSEFVIDLIFDTIQVCNEIKINSNWKNWIKSKIAPHQRYISDSINKDLFILIFLGIRLHIIADTWAHQDFTGFDNMNINHCDGDVLADLRKDDDFVKAPFSFTPSMDTDVQFAPRSGKGHGNMGHYPDYGWLRFQYPAAWRSDQKLIDRNNRIEFAEAWNVLAEVILKSLSQPGEIIIPDQYNAVLKTHQNLNFEKIQAPLDCETCWSNIVPFLKDPDRWKDKYNLPYIGVTRGLPTTRFGELWVKDGSILHIFEIAALMHFTWCEYWTNIHPEYGWKPKHLMLNQELEMEQNLRFYNSFQEVTQA